jgi:hypothetical protein
MTDEYLHFCTENLSDMTTGFGLCLRKYSVEVPKDPTSQLTKNERLKIKLSLCIKTRPWICLVGLRWKFHAFVMLKLDRGVSWICWYLDTTVYVTATISGWI